MATKKPATAPASVFAKPAPAAESGGVQAGADDACFDVDDEDDEVQKEVKADAPTPADAPAPAAKGVKPAKPDADDADDGSGAPLPLTRAQHDAENARRLAHSQKEAVETSRHIAHLATLQEENVRSIRLAKIAFKEPAVQALIDENKALKAELAALKPTPSAG
jgi:hypothetical protein